MSLPSNTPNIDAWEQIYEMDDKDDDKWIKEMREKHNIPEISQITPADHFKYFLEHPINKLSQTKTIWVNGCFDVIHAGHIEMLKYAKSLGQRLVVGLDTDIRVKQSKGESRPINNLENRKKVMESICYVDQVVTFGSDDELKTCIQDSGAQSIVVGAEYKGRVIGSEIVENVILFPRLYDLSTTKIISK